MKIFLICPVRNVSEATTSKIATYVRELEAQGIDVHWPPRDTPQDDTVGMMICRYNAEAIHESDEVHVWYDPASLGSVFDLGMTFMLVEVLGCDKRIVVANPQDVDAQTGKKSFPNVLMALAERHK